MRRILIPALCVLAILAVSATAQAGALSALFYGEPSNLDDTDYEILFNSDGSFANVNDHVLDVGDILVGMFGIQTVYNEDNSDGHDLNIVNGPTFSGVFAVKLNAVSDGALPVLDFTYLSDSEWDDLAGISGSVFPDILPARSGSETMLILFDDPDGIDADAGSLALSLGTADGTYLWEFGFAGDDGEFWRSNAAADVTQIDTAFGLFEAALNLTALPGATAPAIHKYTTIAFSNYLLNGNSLTDITQVPVYLQVSGNLESIDPSVPVGVFDVRSDTNGYMFVTPEPGSVALLGLGLAVLGGAVYRRRRR